MSSESESNLTPGLQTVAAREAALLAPYAMHSADTKGRKHAEPEHPYRGPFQRDRDRIVHSAAYRRLSGKMQVFTGDMGDYHRTRLTHTQEVASIARTIGRALRLNEDLIEALSLLHDIGHPPFGHAGEDALDECLAGEGGFSHNRYALTLAEELEVRYPQFPGLNLTREVLEGQSTRVDKQAAGAVPLLEVQVVEAADSITYDTHDLDDAVKLGLLTLDEMQEVSLVRETTHRVLQRFAALQGKILRKVVVHELIDHQVSDLLRTSGRGLAQSDFADARAAQDTGFRIAPSDELAARKSELEAVLYERVYRHPRLTAVRVKAQQRLRAMFDGYVRRADLLPEKFQTHAGTVGLTRSVGDYLAGMTDRFCDEQFQRYFAADNTPDTGG
jgi:dGTPase